MPLSVSVDSHDLCSESALCPEAIYTVTWNTCSWFHDPAVMACTSTLWLPRHWSGMETKKKFTVIQTFLQEWVQTHATLNSVDSTQCLFLFQACDDRSSQGLPLLTRALCQDCTMPLTLVSTFINERHVFKKINTQQTCKETLAFDMLSVSKWVEPHRWHWSPRLSSLLVGGVDIGPCRMHTWLITRFASQGSQITQVSENSKQIETNLQLQHDKHNKCEWLQM